MSIVIEGHTKVPPLLDIQPHLLIPFFHTVTARYHWAHLAPHPVYGQRKPAFWRFASREIWRDGTKTLEEAAEQLPLVQANLKTACQVTLVPVAWLGQPNSCVLTINKWNIRQPESLTLAARNATLSIEEFVHPERISGPKLLQLLAKKFGWSKAKLAKARLGRFDWNSTEILVNISFPSKTTKKGQNTPLEIFCLEWDEVKHLTPPQLSLASIAGCPNQKSARTYQN